MVGRRWDARFCSPKCASLNGFYVNYRDVDSRDDRSCPVCAEVIPGRAHANRDYCSIKCRNVVRQITSHGLTLDEYRGMLERQDGRCAICRGVEQWKPDDRGFHIDHDHETGRVRGVLCPACNLMLGYAEDDPETLRRAIAYLKL